MLKIKENVNLKELEKFGFRKSGGIYQFDLQKRERNEEEPLGFIISCIYVRKEDSIIRIKANEETEILELTIIYDLIQAGLVEKVRAWYGNLKNK